MKRFLLILSVGLVFAHAYSADRRRPQGIDKSLSRSVASMGRSRPTAPKNMSQSVTSTPTETSYSGRESSVPYVVLWHPFFNPSFAMVPRSCLDSYIREGTRHMLFCAQRQGGGYRVGYVAFEGLQSPSEEQITRKDFNFLIEAVGFRADIFSVDKTVHGERGARENEERCKKYRVCGFPTAPDALSFIQSHSGAVLDDLKSEKPEPQNKLVTLLAKTLLDAEKSVTVPRTEKVVPEVATITPKAPTEMPMDNGTDDEA